MDALHLPRLQASSILPAWRRAWRRKPADAYVPLPASLGRPEAQALSLDDAPTRPAANGGTLPSAERRPAEERLRVRQDPADARRVRLAGSMAEVCAALDRLVLWQESDPR